MEDDVAHHFLTSNGFIENESLYVLNNYDALLKLLEMPNRNIDFVILNDDLLAYRFGRLKRCAAVSKCLPNQRAHHGFLPRVQS